MAFLFLLSAFFLSGCSFHEKEILKPIRTNYTFNQPEFRETMGQLLSAPMSEGNSIRTLVNGEEIFPAMLNAISNAQESILSLIHI